MNLKSTSKFLSLVLRHQPEVIGMQLDPEGWLPVDDLIAGANAHGHLLTQELLREIVATSDKQRFAFSEDGTRIRANQGHSVETVDLNLSVSQPPNELYHGTVARFLDSIRSQGLIKGSRNHVHLSSDIETAMKVGGRRGKPVVLTVHAHQMHEAYYYFFLSANGVWLTDVVPPQFLRFPR